MDYGVYRFRFERELTDGWAGAVIGIQGVASFDLSYTYQLTSTWCEVTVTDGDGDPIDIIFDTIICLVVT
jgi:hypothetical protein